MNHRSNPTKRYAWTSLGLALTAVVALLAVFSTGATAAHRATAAQAPKPTIVLVHGAWASTASWDGVIARLEGEGYMVYAPPNPLRSLQGDADTTADFLKTISGPVVLVGRSYGGAVITNASDEVSNVKALVYVDAFAPAQGESAFALTAKFPGSVLTSAPPPQVFRSVSYPGAPSGDALLYVNPSFFMKGFANDLSPRQAALALATQNPATLSALEDPSGPPAWANIPSWDVVGTIDQPPVSEESLLSLASGGSLAMSSREDLNKAMPPSSMPA